jgi:chemotaxis protein MotC
MCLHSAAVLADGTEDALLQKIRAVSRQYDGIANRGLTQAPGLPQVRDQYLSILRQAAESGGHGQAMREMAEVFVLSGGEAAVLAHWKDGLEPNSTESAVFDGVTAYGEGKTLEAEARLLKLDAVKLDPWRGGHLALAQALLTLRTAPEKAFGFLRTAALLLPGTLVEEAALRQTGILAAKRGDTAEFSSAVTAYFRRFPRSAYLGSFEAQVTFHIVRFAGSNGVRIVQDILRSLPDGWGRCLPCFLTTIAEQAVLTSKVELASVAATAGMALVPSDSRERQRLALYAGAAAILTDKYQDGLAMLLSVQEAKLGEDDRQLLGASLTVADKLRKTPVLFSQLQRSASARPVKGNRIFPVSSREEAARRALADADVILKNAK